MTNIPVLITMSNDTQVWALVAPGTTTPATLRTLKKYIQGSGVVRVNNERPTDVATWDSLETLVNWDHVLGLTAFPAIT